MTTLSFRPHRFFPFRSLFRRLRLAFHSPVETMQQRFRATAFTTLVCSDGMYFVFGSNARPLTTRECRDVPARWREAHVGIVRSGEALFVNLCSDFNRSWPDRGPRPVSVPITKPFPNLPWLISFECFEVAGPIAAKRSL